MAIATFGAGCFWGVEYFFKQLDGVINTCCGYMGGDDSASSYEQVKSGNTGHAEVVQVEYDEERISFEQVLAIFWQNHNPTTLNQQGGDIGSQYRSAIFFHTKVQKEIAERSKLSLARSGKWGERQIVTEIVPALKFNRAEEYHQNYLEKNELPSCHISY
ncbi:peptide-methionine (S)-S-oxide reductase MsrA [uncultured Shewanella sp.]|uniref:peptide-methionine (S)-S-oxide reductase MsrA n=1 Tax=uncultured Shewanella sp. TaxID=173975 RepID=UPI00260E4228|nr:peptide-methionine (S)-S-oxide reductase MsrA [uncultured Shewanella sp.]